MIAPGDDQPFRLHLGRQASHHEHNQHRDDTARRQHQSRACGGVTETSRSSPDRNCVVASRMAPIAGITRKLALNWRVASIRTSTAPLRRRISHGMISMCSSAQTTTTLALKDEPVILQPAIECDLKRAGQGRDQHKADQVEPVRPPPPLAALRRGLVWLVQDCRDRHCHEQAGTLIRKHLRQDNGRAQFCTNPPQSPNFVSDCVASFRL
jgi:hypothetical protein